MKTSTLPDTVQQALGYEAASDLTNWFEEQLQKVGLPITSFIARQKVNVLVLERISNLLLADEPILVQDVSGKMIWRVPVDFTLASQGRVGRVGEIDVDAYHGEIYYDENLLVTIRSRVEQVASARK